MTTKILLSIATTLALGFTSVQALADVPMPECVGNPACQQPGGCSVGALPVGAPAGAGAIALAAAAALIVRRRRVR